METLTAEHLPSVTLLTVAYRIPHRGELYLDRNQKVQRCLEDRSWSRRAKPKPILRESWL